MNFETPHGYENAKRPEDLKNEAFLVQASLMSRSPLGETDWVERYAARFRELFETSDDFRMLVAEKMTDENLRSIQDRLEA